MSGFLQSKQFREAWIMSVLASAFFPFLLAATEQGDELGYLARVNQDFLKTALSFGAVFFVIQIAFGILKYRRAQKMAAAMPLTEKPLTEKTET